MIFDKLFNKDKKKVIKLKGYMYSDGYILDYVFFEKKLKILFEDYLGYVCCLVFNGVEFFEKEEDDELIGLSVIDDKFKKLKNGRKKALFYVCNDNDEEPALEIEYIDGYVDSNPNLDEWPEYLKLQKEREFNIANKQNN